MKKLLNKTIFITGSSRGIGREIALICADNGANVIIAAKSDKPHPKLPGTIHSVAQEVTQRGGNALAIKLDVRSEKTVDEAMALAATTFGGIDVLINNASAISLTPLQQTDIKRYDLIHSINTRGTMVCSKAAIKYLKKGTNPHIITLSPPINMAQHWLKPFIPYTISKYGMTLLALGLAEELRDEGISSSTLWPQTAIATAAIKFALDESIMKKSRTPLIMAEAALEIICTENLELSGKTLIDETILRNKGIIDFDQYKYDPQADELMRDLYLDQ